MRENIIRTENADYVAGSWDGVNRSGIAPLGDNIVVLPDTSSDRAGAKGLIQLPADQIERQSLAAETGIVITCGPDAWTWNNNGTREFQGEKPKPGDHVLFQRYAGRLVKGQDGAMYRVMTDNCVAALVQRGTPNA